jgi:hypothetical protein
MKKNLTLIGAAACSLVTLVSSAFAQGTAFTYQGRLQNGTNFASGKFDLAFSLYATNSDGGAIAGPVTNAAVSVTNGLFTTTVDFGNVFTGGSNWLQIAVSTNGANAFSTVLPRQQLTPVPYAVFASGIAGLSVQQNSSGAPDMVLGSSVNYVSTNVVGATIGGGGATNYLGGGAVSNSVTGNFGTVSGGAQNTANFLEASVGGGYGNTASGQAAAVGGGINNTASGHFATVPGGNGNTASGVFSFAAGRLAQAVNNGSFVWADSQLAYFTSTANDQFLIRAAGGVGIGTATPAKQLDVTGNASGVGAGSSIDPSVFVRVNNSATDGTGSTPDYAGIGFGNNSTRQAIVGGTYGNDYLDFYTGGLLTSPKLRIDFNGSVGIGVTAPSAGLTIGTNAAVQLELRKPGNNPGYQFNVEAGGLDICERNIACGRFYLQNGSGNIGIGTTAPAAHFHVSGGTFESPVAAGLFEVQNCGAACSAPSWTEGIRLMNTEGNVAGLVGIGFLTAPAGSPLTNVPDVWIGNDDKASGNTHSFKIATQSGSVLTNRVFINGASGNFGIGTVSPANKLDVQGSADFSGIVGIGTSSPITKLHLLGSGDTELSIQSSDNSRRWTLQASGGPDGNPAFLGGYFQIIDRTAAASRLLITTNGNIGIGTTGPATKLDVAGEITCTAVNITSDRNAKQNFSPVNPREVLAKVVGLPISEWQYKQNADARHIGPMAQDFSGAFALGADDKHISMVDESGVALAAIQGLNQKLDEKDVRIRELESSVAELKALVIKLAAGQSETAHRNAQMQ